MAAPVGVTLIAHEGTHIALSAKSGRSLMRAAVDAGVDGIAADCGGAMNCATCHVYIDDAWLGRLPPASAEESEMLEMVAAERLPTSRLSCQITLTPELSGLVARLPPHQY